MSRPSLEIDVDVAGDAYGLRSSADSGWGETDSLIQNPAKAPSPASRWPLFSLLSRQQRFFHLAPAILSSVFTGEIAPFMTIVIGHAFDAFSKFSTPLAPSEGDPKELLVHRVGIAALQLVGLALGSFSLSSLTSYLWILTGEHNVLELWKRVYASIAAKDIMWFDTRASDEQPSLDDEQGPLGAGGLMAQFMRETDEVRAASSLATGRIFEYLTTCITCLILALTRSYSLTLVILSAVPVLVIIQASSQAVAGPLLATERQQTAVAATLVDRAAAGISTVKAFTAAPHEQRALAAVLARMDAAICRLVAVWGCTSGLAQFVMMALFVQGFCAGPARRRGVLRIEKKL